MSATRTSHQWPKQPTMRDYLEDDALGFLRNTARTGAGMKQRLSARMYLLQHGWTVAQIDAAQTGEADTGSCI